ncbi:glycosyltransferase [Marisediminicola senii]|uniref:glycosyltransferase n=1 Tax=Marisediminicola senii TaxID=2711233 RepID=UPI0013EA6DAB|nr:glycosyltransferase [Marisediminicola senii]
MHDSEQPSIVAIVPCHNEALAIAQVIADLKAAVPEMVIYVYDNRSTDGTDEVARRAGAEVRYENIKGKGNVIRRAFADIDADIYVMIDGDDTYDATALPGMIRELREGPLDHVVGVRKQVTTTAYRPGHSSGNKAFNALVSWVFGYRVNDMLSGYRVFSRRFVKSFPAVSREFEVETELTVHSMNLRVPQSEVEVGFKDRPEGSESKLNTYRDGFKILRLIASLVRNERPWMFHGLAGGVVFLVSLILGIPIIAEFVQTGLVPRFPTAVLASSLAIIAVLIWLLGLMLDGIAKSRRESSRLTYLALQAPPFQAPRGQAAPTDGRVADAHESDPRAYDRVPVRRAEPNAGR